MHALRGGLVGLALCLALAAARAETGVVAAPASDTTPFSAAELLAGKRTSETECAALASAVWVVVERQGECIRYYHSNAGGSRTEALVVMSSDVVSTNARGEIKPHGYYLKSTPASVQNGSTFWSRGLGIPYLMLARPGTYGSSGEHAKRRTAREIDVISGALDAIKARYGYTRLHLVGNGEGGHAAAALLARRTDLGCVVLSSALVAVRARLDELGEQDVPGNKNVIDPIALADQIAKRSDLRIFVLTDPDDVVISARSQTAYVRRMAAAGLPVRQVFAAAPDPYAHELWRPARPMALDCASAMETETIVKKYENKRPETPPDADDPPLHNGDTLTRGVTVSEAKCKALATAIWIQVDGRGFCVRYFMSAAGGENDAALVFLNGDIGHVEKGRAAFVGSSALLTAGMLQRQARVWSRIYGGPYLEIGRIGTLGSSGNHPKERRTRLELQLETAALDALKEKYGFKRIHLVGQSGGGHNVAALAEMRSDVGCTVVASGLVSVKLRAQELGKVATPGAVDPVDSLEKLHGRTGQRLIVVSDPDDRVVSFRSQRDFVDKAKAKGLPVLQITAAANDAKFHGLSSVSHRIATDCAKDTDDETLVKTYQNKTVRTTASAPAGRR